MRKSSFDGRHRLSMAPVLGAAAVAIIVALSLVAAGGTADPSAVTLQSVSASTLAATGMSLYQAQGTSAISAVQAENAAADAVPFLSSVQPIEAHLVQVQDAGLPSVNGRTLWVVSFPPGGFQFAGEGPVEGTGISKSASYFLVFIDATTGQFVFSRAGT